MLALRASRARVAASCFVFLLFVCLELKKKREASSAASRRHRFFCSSAQILASGFVHLLVAYIVAPIAGKRGDSLNDPAVIEITQKRTLSVEACRLCGCFVAVATVVGGDVAADGDIDADADAAPTTPREAIASLFFYRLRNCSEASRT